MADIFIKTLDAKTTLKHMSSLSKPGTLCTHTLMSPRGEKTECPGANTQADTQQVLRTEQQPNNNTRKVPIKVKHAQNCLHSHSHLQLLHGTEPVQNAHRSSFGDES